MDNIDINDVLKVVNDLGSEEIFNNLQKRVPQISKPAEPVISVASDEPIKIQPSINNKILSKVSIQPLLKTLNQKESFQLMGYSMPYSTLYFIGVMIFIGIVLYFITNKKKAIREHNDDKDE